MYSLVRFAEATNYLAMTWSPEDHAACLDLNLPCWDVTRFLPWRSAQGGGGEALFNTQDYNAICWMRPRVVSYLTSKDFVVHMSGEWGREKLGWWGWSAHVGAVGERSWELMVHIPGGWRVKQGYLVRKSDLWRM